MKRFAAMVVALIFLALACSPTNAENAIRVEWEPVTGATGYRVHFGTESRTVTPYANERDAGNATNLLVVDTVGEIPGANIYVAVVAYNSGGESPMSREVFGWPDPEVTSVDADCDPVEGGGVTCTAAINGDNFSPGVSMLLSYPGLTVDPINRIDSHRIEFSYQVAAGASPGATDLTLRNPWATTPGTTPEGDTSPSSGTVAAVLVGGFNVTPVVIPSTPFGVIRVAR